MNCDKIREYANRLKVQHILEWEREERLLAIAQFASLTVQMKNLTQQHRVELVQTAPPTAYVKTGKKRGRPPAREVIAKTNTTINQFYQPAHSGGNERYARHYASRIGW